ncbi:MAG: hypothetical protein K9I85_12255 [Saprospiraceae bacterium]|nr:hypothetical protein [Saprospiraceae bacterium]
MCVNVQSLYFRFLHKGTLTRGLLLVISLVFLPWTGQCQETSDAGKVPSSWSSSFPTRTLVLILPTYAVKHQRILASVQALPPDASSRKQAERIMQRDRAYRDTLVEAMQASFKEFYQIGKVRFMADTTYTRWQKGLSPLTWTDTQGQTTSITGLEKDEVIFLKKKRTSRETGTGVEVWMAIATDRQTLPSRFPDQFREGSLGTRFVRFMEAFFTFSSYPDTLEEQRVVTDYLADHINRKWSTYMSSFDD